MKCRKTVLLSYQFWFCAVPSRIIPIGSGFVLVCIALVYKSCCKAFYSVNRHVIYHVWCHNYSEWFSNWLHKMFYSANTAFISLLFRLPLLKHDLFLCISICLSSLLTLMIYSGPKRSLWHCVCVCVCVCVHARDELYQNVCLWNRLICSGEVMSIAVWQVTIKWIILKY